MLKNPKCPPNIVYFDNNSTTLICTEAANAFNNWIKCYNPSSDSKLAKPAKDILEKAVNNILLHCNVSTATHTAVFTSGGTESNCFILRACARAFKRKLKESDTGVLPHIIISATEHHSIIECAEDLEKRGDAVITKIQPTIYGNILPEDIEKEILPNTCLVSIMYANNEIPVINNLEAIAQITHRHKIPLHSDCVQIFGKFYVDLKKTGIDAISASFHKLYGPKGVGLLILSNNLIEGYELKGEINGSQQHGLRGGTENIPGIVSSIMAVKHAFKNRNTKNHHLYNLRQYCLEKLKEKYIISDIKEFIIKSEAQRLPVELVSLGPPEDKKEFILPNTILLSICKNNGAPFCNVQLKHYLDSQNIVVGIGSACLTASDKASHVLYAINAPPVIRRGVLRISFCDDNSKKEIDKFIKILDVGIKKQCRDIEHLLKTRPDESTGTINKTTQINKKFIHKDKGENNKTEVKNIDSSTNNKVKNKTNTSNKTNTGDKNNAILSKKQNKT